MLAHGIADKPPVLPQHRAIRGNKIPRLRRLARVALNDPGIIPIRDEADVLTVRLAGIAEARRLRQVPDLLLAEFPQGEKRPGQLLLGQHVEHIALILALIGRLPQPVFSLLNIDAGIVTGGNISAAKEICPLEQRAKLQIAVAVDAGIWGKSPAVACHEFADDLLPEFLRKVENIVGDPQAEGSGASVLDILQTAAGPVWGDPCILVAVKLHGTAGARIARVPQELGRRAGIYAAAHGHQDLVLPCRTPCHLLSSFRGEIWISLRPVIPNSQERQTKSIFHSASARRSLHEAASALLAAFPRQHLPPQGSRRSIGTPFREALVSCCCPSFLLTTYPVG